MKANVGMLYPVAAPITAYTPGSAPTYGAGTELEEARGATLTWERADGRFYGNNVELASDNRTLGYSIDFEPSGLTDAGRALLLGEVAASDEYTITDDPSPDVGFGYIRNMEETQTNGLVTETFEGWWFYKVKFSLNSEETRTRERDTEWRVPTLTGTGAGVQLTAGGKLSFATHETFNTLAAAKTWLNGKASIT